MYAGPRERRERQRRLLHQRASALGLGVLTFLSSQTARAGNADAFYLSGEAALSAGAITATTSGGGSIWYNPSGLAGLSGLRLDVNVSGYAVRFGATADFDSSVPNTKETRLSLIDLDVVPAAVTLTRKFGNVGVGLGVFVPSQSAVILRTQLESPPNESGYSLNFGYDSTSRFQEYHMGPGLGFQVLRSLNLGASLLVNYRTRVEVTDISATVESPTTKTSAFTHTTLDSQSAGLEMVIGGQWRPLPRWSLGAVVRTPAVRMGESVHSVDMLIVADDTGRVEEQAAFSQRFGVSAQVLTPFRFHAGAAYEFADSVLSMDGSVILPFKNEVFQVQERMTINARAGIRSQVSEFWKVGGGIFTDRSALNTPTQFQQSQLDYYGATLAVDWERAYGVISKGRRVLEEPRSLIFGTTVALSYAIGLGNIAGARVGPSAGGGIEFERNVVDVVAHEITLHIGSALFE